jgi:hypothetical protein
MFLGIRVIRGSRSACHHPPMQLLFPISILVTVLALVGSLATMLVLRFRGRSIPPWLVRCAVAALGLQSGLTAILFVRQPTIFGALAVQLGVAIWFLWRAAGKTSTGMLLLLTALPGALWWGFFLVQDAIDPADLYLPNLWLWFAPSAVLLVVGGFLVRLGDLHVEGPVFPQAASLRRDPMPLANALARESSIGPLPLASLVSDGMAFLVAIAVVSLLGSRLPWPIVLIAAAGAYTLISSELYYYALSPRLRRAWEGMAVLGNPGMKRWRAETGTSVPTSPAAMRNWLRATPDRPEIRWARAEIQALLGELEAARTSAEGMLLRSDADRFEQRTLLSWIGWLDGEDEDFDALTADAELVGGPGSAERLEARARVSQARARDIAARGGDWKRPLEELRQLRGQEPSALLRADLRRARYRVVPLVALAVSGISLLLVNLPAQLTR